MPYIERRFSPSEGHSERPAVKKTPKYSPPPKKDREPIDPMLIPRLNMMTFKPPDRVYDELREQIMRGINRNNERRRLQELLS